MRNIIIFLLSAQISLAYSQACCSSGTPIVGSIALPPANNGQWSMAFTFAYNNLNDLYSGSEKVDEDFRLRQTSAIIFETSYGISDLFAVNILGSFVSQERTIDSNVPGQPDNYIRTIGLGDGAIMATYRPIRKSILNPGSLDLGIGVKAPIGESQLKLSDILLPVDLQPGTGSWDYFFRANYFYSFKPLNNFDLFSTVTYRLNGDNDQGYKVGNELLLFVGGAYRFSDNIRIISQLNYRLADQNQLSGEETTGTGGTWLFFIPGFETYFTDQLGIRISGSIPLYQDLNGIQLTTTYTYTISMFYFFN